MLHEALLTLFRNRPTFAPELLREALGVELPPFTEARVQDTCLTQVVPAELRADLVVLLSEGVPVYGIVVEAQLGRDEDKRFTWPLYAMALRAQIRAPTCVLVVSPDEAVAQWAARPIDTGQPGSPFVPLVLGPVAMPRLDSLAKARDAPELCVLSVLAHGKGPDGVALALTAIAAASSLDDARAVLYYDLVLAALNEAGRRMLEELMASGRYEFQSDFARKYFSEGVEEGMARGKAEGLAEGLARGKAEVLLKIFAGRGLRVSESQRARIRSCSEVALLDCWIDRALQASSVEDALS